MKTIYTTKILGNTTTYMGDSLREAQEMFDKSRTSCTLFKREAGAEEFVVLASKNRDNMYSLGMAFDGSAKM